MRRGRGVVRGGRRVYQRPSDALNRAAPSSPLMTSAETADEPDDEEDDQDQADEPDPASVVVPPRVSISVAHSPEQDEQHHDHDDEPEHPGASTTSPMPQRISRIRTGSARGWL